MQSACYAVFACGLRHEADTTLAQYLAIRSEHRTIVAGLRCWKRGVGVAHIRPADDASLEYHLRFCPEELRLPQHQVGNLALAHRAERVRDAKRDGRVDGYLRQIAQYAEVIILGAILV